MASIYWLVAFVMLAGIEAATMALTTIWFAGGAFAAFLVSLFGLSIEVQLAVFVAVSCLLLFLTRPFVSKYINSHTVRTNADSLVGKSARVTVEINNAKESGTAVVGGQEWTARALDDKIYPVGTQVVIQKIQGVKLMVSVPSSARPGENQPVSKN